jgi:hypothetical protein
MDRPRDKHRRGLVIRIELSSPARVFLSFREVAFAVRFRGLVQLVLGPDSIDNSAPGASSNEDRQNDDDPGLREFHLCVTPI